ncbi:peptidase [Ferriphaselus sp. R-1]|uniref:LexA family protein n=1 Tax=Ferriphaselus sp. R-1 TaxID=1485544 RepID=UPI0005538F9F|nr:peptidase [Ferriphaselus sp. R-1]
MKTAKQNSTNDREHLARLQAYYAEYRTFPSYARLMEILGFASKSAIKKVLERLEAAGMLERTPDGDWAPSDSFFERTIASQPVPAGSPVAVSDETCEQVMLDRFLIEKPAQTVIIRVKGESMIDAGIHSGDLAIVERRTHAQPGELVVGIVDDEFTLKTLGRDKEGFHLIPANPDFSIIRPQGKLEIFGVVVGLVRKYS